MGSRITFGVHFVLRPNKIGVNLNQLSKRINSFAGYNVGDNDRQLLRQAFDMMRNCLILLQKLLH